MDRITQNVKLACYDMVKEAIFTEKSFSLEERYQCLSFFTYKSVNKKLIKDSIESLFSTKVISVRVLNTKGRIKYFRNRIKYTTKSKKKVFISVENFNNVMEVLRNE
jgi:large subunit ribosomal protein L23